nr:hypothetical protein [Endozoicomonas sp.]
MKQSYGIRAGEGPGMHFTGPIDIRLHGIRSVGVASMPGPITFNDSLIIDAGGIYSSGIYLSPVNGTPAAIQLNGATDIHAIDQDNTSLKLSGGMFISITPSIYLPAPGQMPLKWRQKTLLLAVS